MKFVGLFFILINVCLAHPTSFKDSVGLMGSHDQVHSHLQVNYSFDYWQAIGLHYYNFQNQDQEASYLSYNLLLKRWNGQKFQANLYFGNGLGTNTISKDLSMLNFLQFDIEDRRLYFLYKYSRIGGFKNNDFNQHKLRFGFAPYEGNFDELNSWIIFEYMKTDVENNTFNNITPFVRLFYKNILIEMGMSFNGSPRFNYITHF